MYGKGSMKHFRAHTTKKREQISGSETTKAKGQWVGRKAGKNGKKRGRAKNVMYRG